MSESDRRQSIEKVMKVWKEKNDILYPDQNRNIVDIIDQIAGFFAVGSYYYYIFNFETMSLEYVHHTIKDVLGYDPEEISLEKMLELYHPDDLAKMHEKENAAVEFLFNQISPEDITQYKVVYLNRFKTSGGSYKKILHQAKAIDISLEGKIQRVIGVHTDISYLTAEMDHKVSFISSTLPSYYSIDPKSLSFNTIDDEELFTRSEVKIIELMSRGKTAKEIGEILFITEHTVKSHRKNIMRKSGAKNAVELIANCIREGIIS